MRIEVGSGLCADTVAHSIDEVVGNDGVHRAEVHLAGMVLVARFHKVLNECLHTEEDILKALQLLDAVDEGIHRRLALGQFHRAVLIPERLVAHHGIGIAPLLGLSPEQLLGQGIEGIVTESGGTYHDDLGNKLSNHHFHNHVIHRESPFAIGQACVFLHHLQVFHEVHVTALGYGEITPFHMEGGICDDIQLSTESEILLVVGNELEVVTKVTPHIHRILDIEPIERYGILADGTGKGVLQQSYLVVIDVHIGEDILQCHVEDVACLQEMVNARGILPLDDFLLTLGFLAVDVLGDCLIHGDGQDQFVVVRTEFHLVEQPLALANKATIDVHRVDVVDGEGDFLVFVKLVEVMVFQVGTFLGGNDPSHQLHGRIVLSAVFAAFLFHHHLRQLLGIGFELDIVEVGNLLRDHNSFRLIPHGTESQVPSVVPFDGITSLRIATYGDMVTLIRCAGVKDSVARHCVCHHTMYLSIGSDSQHIEQ